MKNKILIIGGDSRQLYMADYLESNGFEVLIYGLPEKNRECVGNLADAVRNSDIIIFPLPVSKDSKNIFSITSHGITSENAIKYINKNHIVFGGMIDKSTYQKLLKKTSNIWSICTFTKAYNESPLHFQEESHGNFIYLFRPLS